jgi:Domain of unknown function (DUF4136)
MRRLLAPLFNGFLIAAIVLIAGCATPGPEIRRDTNPAINLTAYKTFGFFSPLATDTAGYESMLTGHLKGVTRRMMEAKGFVYSENNPDVLVNFYVNVQDVQEIRSSPTYVGGYYGYRAGYYGGYYGGFAAPTIETINYQEGTLTVDIVDAKRKVVAWAGTAEGRVSKEARRNPGPAIDAVVTEMMAPMPGPGRM